MTGLRPLVRLAIRDARRDRWRSLLILVIVALPVAGLVVAATLTDSGSPTASENATAALGRADLVLSPAAPAGAGEVDHDALVAAIGDLPDGTVVEVQRSVSGAVPVDGLSVPVTIEDASLSPDALAAGQRELLDGTAPTSADAVAVSGSLRERAGLDLGDRVRIDPLGEVTVVGTFHRPEHLSRLGVVVAPGSLEAVPDTHPELLVDLPDGVDPEQLGPTVAVDGDWPTGSEPTFLGRTRVDLEASRFSQGERYLFIIVGGLAAVEVALVAGAAFAVSVRRRQRELGLLAATGGTRSHVRGSVLLLGGTVGVGGAAAGVLLGLAASAAALPWLSGIADRVVTGLRIDPAWVAGSAALGVTAAVAGAWWPARSVAKLPVLTALSGRRPTPAPAATGLVKGLVLTVVGVALCAAGSVILGGNPFVFLAGSVAVVLGAGLTSPWLLEQLGRLARFLPAGPRLAVRDAARFRTRNGPIVTAAMAGLAASVTIGAVVTSLESRDAAWYEPSLPDDVLVVNGAGIRGAGDAVGSALGRPAWPMRPLDAEVVQREPSASSPEADDLTYVSAAVVDVEVATALAGTEAGADLAAGRAVALRGDAGLHEVEVRPSDPVTGELGEPVATLPVVTHSIGLSEPSWHLRDLLLPPIPELLAVGGAGAGWDTTDVIALDGPIDDETFRRATRAAAAVGPDVGVVAERGYQSSYQPFGQVAMVVGGLAGLLIVAVAIALAAAESRADLRTLTAVGAGRRTRRSLAAGRALLLSGLGGVLAVPVGLLPAAALLSTLVGRPPLVLPWTTIAVVAGLVPLLATAGAVLVSLRDPGRLTRAA